jgi:gliding motility-associated-like protein
MKKRFLFYLVLCLLSVQLTAQNISNRGKEFWVGYGHHQFMEYSCGGGAPTNTQEMILYFSAEQAATVTVTINNTAWTRTYNIPANTVIASDLIPKSGAIDARLISLPCSFVPPGTPCGGEGIFTNHGIRIVSNVPIVAYAHIYGSASSGATMLLPVDSWGYNYYSINSRQTYDCNTFSWFYAIAKEDNTLIEVTPIANSRTGRPANVPFTVSLNRGQIYQIMAGPEAPSTKLEMTGSRIRSIANASGNCYPIAVFSGSSRTTNPISCGSGGGDNDNQQLFPTSTWGKQYLTAPTSRSGAANQFHMNSYKVIVKDPTTIVRKNGIPLGGLNNNYYFFESNTADYIEADKPVMVGQFMTGGAGCLGSGVGDPEMIIISPIEQGIKNIGFYRNTRENISVNYLTLIIPTAGVSSLRIDGSAVFDHTYPHPQRPGYTVVVKRWTSAQTQAKAFSDSAFTAITYGLGNVESYGYNAGTFLNNLNLRGFIRNNSDTTTAVTQHAFTCKNSPVTLSALYIYKPTKLVWEISSLGANITPNADVTDNSPVANDSTIINGIKYYKYTLPGTYVFNNTGTFTIPITSSHPTIENCLFSEKLSYEIEVKATPRPNFTYTHTGCTTDTLYFTGSATTLNGYNNQQYLWTFPGPATANTKDTKRVLPPGIHPVNFRVVTTDGCVGDTTQNITVNNRPVADFNFTPSNICEGDTVSFTTTFGNPPPSPSNAWYWDFGFGAPVNATSPSTQKIVFPGPGSYTVKHVVNTSATCFSDTTTKIVTVYGKPSVSFALPPTCTNTTGLVNFNGIANATGGQLISSYNWNFNDANANAGNPNTSTLQNPSHIYIVDGTYNVTFSATTDRGCTKDTIRVVPIGRMPVINYPALTAVCENVSGTVSVATATVSNVTGGSGIYKGPATTPAGLFTPSVAGPGTHVIWYVYTTPMGCKDSVSNSIIVRARPAPNFTVTPIGCLPANGLITFTNTTTISDGQSMTYQWLFGDGNNSNLNSPTHNYTAENTYAVKLTATTANNCVKDTTINVPVSIKPALQYNTVFAPVCMGTTPFSVATATVTNNIAGTGVYSGPGVNVAGLFDPTAAGAGTHAIKYVFTTNAGCKDSVSNSILVRARPVPNFTVTPTGCLPVNGLITFTNTTTISDGQSMTYQWLFGDGNNSNLNSPTHNYTAENTYAVKLTATTANNCVKDTTINVPVGIKPALQYNTVLAPVCMGTAPFSIATATVTNNIAGTGVYSGPGVNAAGLFDPTAAGAGTHAIKYVFTTNAGCKDSVSNSILVRARPVPDFTVTPSGCLPTNGLIQFINQTTISDGQSLSYNWFFDDGGASSNLINPTYSYTAERIYNVKLTVNTNQGCIKDTTIAVTVGIKPALVFGVLQPVCESAAPLSVAQASVTNGVNGTGIYKGPGTNAAGNFNPALAGGGVHIIWYVFTTTGGCVDSVSRSITVQPKPTASFTVTPDICLNQQATFTSTSTISVGAIQSWNWNFGDGNTAQNNNGNPFTRSYAAFGPYTVKLVAISSAGCISDTATRTVSVHAMPVASFRLPPSVCMPNGVSNFTNQSSTPDNASMTYVWTFGDASSPVNTTNASHVYAAIGSYNVRLVATTSFGCSDDTVQVMSAFFDKPVALFTVSPDTLCQGSDNVFTDQSTAPNSTIQGWRWNFDDGSTSTQRNPVKRYNNPDIYTISLLVTNAVGCVSDTFKRDVVVYLQPVVDAGQSFVVPQGTTLQFNATANNPAALTFSWSPSTGLNNATLLKPTLVANSDQTYTITARGQGNCTASDFLTVKILRKVKVPNAFSPNGDGINDTWVLENLVDYPGATVEIFNRYGQRVFRSNGYSRPWDGRYNGQPLPVATYYYVIKLNSGFEPLTGSVTIVQ